MKRRVTYWPTGFLVLMFFLVQCNGQKNSTGTKNADATLKKKYADLLGVDVKNITDVKLYHFIDEWWGAPYVYGGKTIKGVDCSGLVANLYLDVYKKTVTGSAATLYENSDKVSEKNLEEGDLVFFKISGDKVSHVGVYLQNRHFVHASSHKGVIISSLDEAYYKKYYYKGGRLK